MVLGTAQEIASYRKRTPPGSKGCVIRGKAKDEFVADSGEVSRAVPGGKQSVTLDRLATKRISASRETRRCRAVHELTETGQGRLLRKVLRNEY